MIGRPINNITGKKIGDLTVLNRVENGKRANGREFVKYSCKCSCGIIKDYEAGDLINREKRLLKFGGIVSCGCKRRKSDGESAFNNVLYTYKKHAEERGYEFKISSELFKTITQENCYYCGSSPNNEFKTGCNTGSYTYNGLDRIDNKQGYTEDNIVPCCKTCNIAKRAMTKDEFLQWIERVYNHSIESIFL